MYAASCNYEFNWLLLILRKKCEYTQDGQAQLFAFMNGKVLQCPRSGGEISISEKGKL